jgi:glycosyltransferase involved in cell wall biosynthesis
VRSLRILQICTYDRGGGAEQVAMNLHRAYRELGHDARMAVGSRLSDTPGVFEFDPYADAAPWAGLFATLDAAVGRLPNVRGRARAQDWLRRSALPQRWFDGLRGREDFNYPAAHQLLAGPWQPDVIHAHNLHGDYFDLRALTTLSQQVPLIWTLHDAWALTGHCAHPIDCQRWRSGCGSCPDLHRPPAIRRDRTAENWRHKRQIYAASRLAVATPSRWLMTMVEQAQLRPWRSRVIDNGVDLETYRPGDQLAARQALGLPPEAFIGLFVAYGASNRNPYKDVTTVAQAVSLAAEQAPGDDLRFVCIGRSPEPGDDPQLISPGYIADRARLALYYQAADLLLHAARAETFGLVIAEAMACGTAVLATDVGGIGEVLGNGDGGWLVPGGDAEAMARQLLTLMHDRAAVARAGEAAAARARERYGLKRQAEAYLSWFAELCEAYAEREQLDLRFK